MAISKKKLDSYLTAVTIPTQWPQSLVITLPKKGSLQQCNNYRTISLICHPSKVMLRIILKRLRPQAEAIIAEEQVGFKAGWSTTEQIFNLRILCATMNYYINANLIHVIQNLHDKASSAVYLNEDNEDWF